MCLETVSNLLYAERLKDIFPEDPDPEQMREVLYKKYLVSQSVSHGTVRRLLSNWNDKHTSKHEGGLMLQTDVSHRVMRTDTVLDIMRTMHNKNSQGFKDEVARMLNG